MRIPLLACAVLLSTAGLLSAIDLPAVSVRELPPGGIKPCATVDAAGVIHAVYFSGEPQKGDAYYAKSSDAGVTWSAAIRVNSQPGSVIGVSSIRGPQIAMSRSGRAHVLWNGSGIAQPKGSLNPAMPADSPFNGTPLLYARLNDAGTAFEAQRNLMGQTHSLDGGSSIAADNAGNVFALWHGAKPGGEGEKDRDIWVAQSTDDGKTFAVEKPLLPEATGVCGCCSVGARALPDGRLSVLFRAATQVTSRDIYSLQWRPGSTASLQKMDPLESKTCPMSSSSIAPGDGGQIQAWETAGVIRVSLPQSKEVLSLGKTPAKYPSVAAGKNGTVVIAWTEGMGWNKGGTGAWTIVDATGKQLQTGRLDKGVPANGRVEALAMPDGSFVLLH